LNHDDDDVVVVVAVAVVVVHHHYHHHCYYYGDEGARAVRSFAETITPPLLTDGRVGTVFGARRPGLQGSSGFRQIRVRFLLDDFVRFASGLRQEGRGPS